MLRPFRVLWGSPALESSSSLEDQLKNAFDRTYEHMRLWLEDARERRQALQARRPH